MDTFLLDSVWTAVEYSWAIDGTVHSKPIVWTSASCISALLWLVCWVMLIGSGSPLSSAMNVHTSTNPPPYFSSLSFSLSTLPTSPSDQLGNWSKFTPTICWLAFHNSLHCWKVPSVMPTDHFPHSSLHPNTETQIQMKTNTKKQKFKCLHSNTPSVCVLLLFMYVGILKNHCISKLYIYQVSRWGR